MTRKRHSHTSQQGNFKTARFPSKAGSHEMLTDQAEIQRRKKMPRLVGVYVIPVYPLRVTYEEREVEQGRNVRREESEMGSNPMAGGGIRGPTGERCISVVALRGQRRDARLALLIEACWLVLRYTPRTLPRAASRHLATVASASALACLCHTAPGTLFRS